MCQDVLFAQHDFRPRIVQHALAAQEPRPQRRASFLARLVHALDNGGEDLGQVGVAPRCYGGKARGVDDGVAAVVQKCILDGLGIFRGALDNGDLAVYRLGEQSLEFGRRSDKGDHVMAVCEERGDEADAKVASCADDKDLHDAWGS
jgi:hypothetical protein